MTTIAFRDGVMASDSQITASGVIEGAAPKIFRLKNGAIVGITGDLSRNAEILRWVESDYIVKPEKVGEYDFNVIVAYPDNSVICGEKTFTCCTVSAEYYAIGTGSSLAYGAMAHGATAEQAVIAAIKHDIYSGGDVICLCPTTP